VYSKNSMKRFSINLYCLKVEILLECIIRKSQVAQKEVDFKDFYTYKGKPNDWQKSLISDIRKAEKIRYKNRDFLVVKQIPYSNKIAYVFYQDCLYHFDEYYTDCPIFEQILNGTF